MQMEVQCATEQTVAAFLVDIEPRAARDHEVEWPRPGVERALERALPATRLVNFVEHDQGDRLRSSERRGHLRGVIGPPATEGDVVPVVIGAGLPLVE